MELVHDGRTKTVYVSEGDLYIIRFKDQEIDGKIQDGPASAAVRSSAYFFSRLATANIPTHFRDADSNNGTLTVQAARPLCGGTEITIRYYAEGSFMERYGDFCQPGHPLNGLVEIALKRKKDGDPIISREIILALDILSEAECDLIVDLAKTAADVVRTELSQKGLTLYDITFEFGENHDGQIMLIDEISGNSMTVYYEGKKLSPMALMEQILS